MVQTATTPTTVPENPSAIFDTAIADAERLLELFDKLSPAERKDNKVLKDSFTGDYTRETRH